MKRHGIPTAHHSSFDSFVEASAYVRSVFTNKDHRIVIKADGLAAGKGVVLPETPEQALEDLQSIMNDGRFSTAGSSVVIEEYMEGFEISILTFSDGNTFFSLPAGQTTRGSWRETRDLTPEAWEFIPLSQWSLQQLHNRSTTLS